MSNEALNNADELIEQVMGAVDEYLKNGHPVNCQYFIGEVMYKMREAALKVSDENVAQAARMLSMNRTTFYEFLRLKGWKRTKPIRQN
jgi:DNA-binding NtrC family response regulator